MSNRFAEIANAKWCKICNVNIVEGAEHPDLNAHIQSNLEEVKLAEKSAQLQKSLEAKSSFIPVSSNDMLQHIAQQGSPETLCGRLITDLFRPSTTSLVCDVCAELSKGASFLVNSDSEVVPAYSNTVTAANYTRDGYKIDDDGFTVLTNEESSTDAYTYTRFVAANELEEETVDSSESDEEVYYLGSYEFDEPVQFTAHWLEEDNEEPLFLPNDEL